VRGNPEINKVQERRQERATRKKMDQGKETPIRGSEELSASAVKDRQV